MTLWVIVGLVLVTDGLIAWTAARRGASAGTYFFLSVLLTPLAGIILFLISAKPKPSHPAPTVEE